VDERDWRGTGARLVAGRYTVVEELGRGGMGVVWRAQDVVIGRQVALKEVQFPVGLSDEERAVFAERVLREARASGRLNHPGIVIVHDVLPQSDAVYIVMELVEAPTLVALVARDGPLPADRAASVGRQVLSALRKAHDAGIVHRDVKPGNIMVLPGDHVKLADFGIAHVTEDTRLTSSGVLGSPGYMAPELFLGGEPSPASDLWSLGATLYFTAEGHAPFERGSAGATLHAVMYDNPRPARPSGPLATVISGLLTRDAAERLTADQAHELLDELPTPVSRPADDATTKSVPAPQGAETSPVMPQVWPVTPQVIPGYNGSIGMPRTPAYRLAVLLTVIGLVVFAGLGVGGYLLLRPSTDASCQFAPDNLAFVDPAATSEVVDQTVSAVERLFSYNYTDVAATESAAQELLTGDALSQYQTLMGEVKRLAPVQKIVATVQVIASAPAEVSDTRAKTLVVVQQHVARTDNNQTNTGIAELLLTTTRNGGAWKITDLNTAPSLSPQPRASIPSQCPLSAEQQTAVLRDTAQDAGRHAAEVFTTIDTTHIEQSLTAEEGVATGELLDELRKGRANTIATYQKQVPGTIVTGTAKAAALSELDGKAGTAKMLVGIDAQITQAQGTPAAKHSTLILTLARTEQGWKASAIELVGARL
jgi:serine/threonine protein kinase